MAKDATQGPTDSEWNTVNTIISERTAGFPPRVLQELNRVKPALQKLVAAKVPFREINDRFAKRIPIKISAAQFRKYMKQEFDYPPSPSARPKAKKTGPSKTAAKRP